MTDRKTLSDRFVLDAGWAQADRRFLAGDASPRSYDRLTRPSGETAVLMDAPPARGEDIRPFIKIARHLEGLGLSTPKILAHDAQQGFMLLEDLGDRLFARHLETAPQDEVPLYRAAAEVLAHLQASPPPSDCPDHTPDFMAEAAGLSISWYAKAVLDTPQDPQPLIDAMAETMARHCTSAPVLVLRDFHAENLLWLPDRQGLAKVGLLDFQMGSKGQPEYDLVSMLQDARRDVAPQTEAAMIAHFATITGKPLAKVQTAYAVLGAQRALRILGGFTRLSLHFGKPAYVRLIPRVWAHLQTNLAHPALQPLAEATRLLPPPTPEALQRITQLCGTVPNL